VTAHDTARDALAEAQNRLTRALLIEPGDVAELIGAIKDQAEAPIRAVIIDTLARTMHRADENSAAAMGLFADHCARIIQEILDWICPDTAWFMRRVNTVSQTINKRPRI